MAPVRMPPDLALKQRISESIFLVQGMPLALTLPRGAGLPTGIDDPKRTFVIESPRPRVLLADDNTGILLAFDRLLRSSCDVVGRVSDGAALLDAISTLQPDVVVLDLFMPEIDGLETYSRIFQLAPRAKIVVVTAADDESLKEQVLSAGASAFVAKPRVVDDLLPAIQRVLAKSASTV